MPMPTTKELLEKRGAIAARAKQLSDTATDRVLTTEERSTFATIEKEVSDLDAEMANLATRSRLDAIANFDPSQMPKYNDDASRDNPFHEKNLVRFQLRNIFRHGARRECNWDSLVGVEGECHKLLMEDSKRMNPSGDTNGVMIPHCLPIHPERRTTNTTTMAGSLQTWTDGTLLDVLRNQMVARRAGARIITGLSGLFELPKKSLANTVRWAGESPAEALTDMSSGKITFSPKSINASTRVTQRLMEQTSLDVEAESRRDIAMAIAIGADSAVFNGTGSSNQPLGLQTHPDLTTIALGTNGAAPTFAKMVSMKTTRNAANADLGDPAWITSSVGVGKLETTEKVANYPVFLVENGKMNGFPVHETNQIPSNLDKGSSTDILTALYFGDFSQIMIGLWGGARLIMDPYKYEPDIKLSLWQTMDVQLRYGQAITRCLDLLY